MWKFLSGALIFVLLMVVLFLPLLIYSTFNPSLVVNRVTSVQTEISFEGTSPFYSAQIVGDTGIRNLSRSNMALLARTRSVLEGYDVASSFKSSQLITAPKCSSNVWSVSPASRAALVDALRTRKLQNVLFSTTFTRTAGDAGTNVVKVESAWPMPPNVQSVLLKMLESEEYGNEVPFPRFYTPFILSLPGTVRTLPTTMDTQDCAAKLTVGKDLDSGMAVRIWCMQCNSLFPNGNDFEKQNETGISASLLEMGSYDGVPNGFTQTPLYYVVTSDNVPAQTLFPNIGIIALYTTFILALGQVIRARTTGSSHRVLLQDVANTQPLEEILQFIFLARAMNEYALEEQLYYELIDLLRSPQDLFARTGRLRDLYGADGRLREVGGFLNPHHPNYNTI